MTGAGKLERSSAESRVVSPLTRAQLGIWMGQTLYGRSDLYQTAEAVTLRGRLDEAAFVEAIADVLERTPSLRVTIEETPRGLEQVLSPRPAVAVERHDFRDALEPESAAELWMASATQQCAPLDTGPLFRTAVLRLGESHWLWYLSAHHLLLDGFGYAKLQNEVAETYRAIRRGGARRVAASIGLEALVREELAYEASDAYVEDERFWKSYLLGRGEPPTIAERANGLAAVLRVSRPLPIELVSGLRARAKALRCDFASVVLAILAEDLFEETGVSRWCIGLPVANRLGSVALALPCMAMNIVPVWIERATGDSFVGRVEAIQSTLAQVRPHQRYRYEAMRRWTGVAAGSRNLFGPLLNLMEFGPRFTVDGVTSGGRTLASGPVEDLAVNFVTREGATRLEVMANSAAYTPGEVERRVARLASELMEVVDGTRSEFSSGGLPIDDSKKAFVQAAPPVGPVRDVLSAILRQAELRPLSTAIIACDQPPCLYGELCSLIAGLAGALEALGVRDGQPIGLLLPRSPQAIALKLAVLALGAHFVPMDPDGPRLRNQAILDTVRPRLVVVEHALGCGTNAEVCSLSQLLAHSAPSYHLSQAWQPEALAYVLFTSGTTGDPRGVEIERGAVSYFVHAALERYQIASSDRVLQFANAWFDASIEEEWVTLAAGGTLCLRPPTLLDSVSRFIAECDRLRLTVLDLPTAFFHVLAQEMPDRAAWAEPLRLVIVGGEALMQRHLDTFLSRIGRPIDVVNSYGPTEATVVCATAAVTCSLPGSVESREPPLGTPLAGVGVAILDERLRVVDRDESGQLGILGPTLARGYLADPRANSERFVELMLEGKPQRAYLTGDRVTMDATGCLWFHGRVDDELKVSGHRLNPLEIERCLLRSPGVQEAKVLVHGRRSGKPKVLAFIRGRGTLDEVRLRESLAEKLAPPLLPDRIVQVSAFPRNDRGKIDRDRLLEQASSAKDETELLTELEQAIVEVWHDVLGCGSLSRRSSFFDSGGRSLQVLQVAHRLSLRLGVEVLPSQVLQASSIEALAVTIERESGCTALARVTDPLGPLVWLQRGRSPSHLFCVHSADCLATCYVALGDGLPTVNLCGIQAQGLRGEIPRDFESMVDGYVELVLSRQVEGPYHLLGWSSGGGIAHAMACRLQNLGREVRTLALLDAHPAERWQAAPEPTEEDAWVMLLDDIDASGRDVHGRALSVSELRARVRAPGSSLASMGDAELQRLADTVLEGMKLYRRAKHPSFHGNATYFRAALSTSILGPTCPFSPYVSSPIEIVDVQATHLGMCERKSLSTIARHLVGTIV